MEKEKETIIVFWSVKADGLIFGMEIPNNAGFRAKSPMLFTKTIISDYLQ